MLMKVFILLIMLAILGSLASALVYLLKNKQSGTALVKALTYRIGFSVALFLLLLIAYAVGWIKPHGLG